MGNSNGVETKDAIISFVSNYLAFFADYNTIVLLEKTRSAPPNYPDHARATAEALFTLCGKDGVALIKQVPVDKIHMYLDGDTIVWGLVIEDEQSVPIHHFAAIPWSHGEGDILLVQSVGGAAAAFPKWLAKEDFIAGLIDKDTQFLHDLTLPAKNFHYEFSVARRNYLNVTLLPDRKEYSELLTHLRTNYLTKYNPANVIVQPSGTCKIVETNVSLHRSADILDHVKKLTPQ
jgi:hypothetical protein